MIDLLLALIDDGTSDASESEEVRSDDLWFALRDMAKDRPEEAAEVIGRWLDRSCASAEWRDRRRPFGSGINHERSAADVIRNVAEREPAGFLRHLLHRIVAITARHARPDDDGLLRDAVWPRRSFGSDRAARTAILTSAARAMEVQAASDPNALDGLTAGLDASSRETVAFLLLRAWSANGRRYAERAAEFLASVPARLDVGYSSWGFGNGHAAVSRAALGAITAHCSDAALQRLEAAIIGFSPRWSGASRSPWGSPNCSSSERSSRRDFPGDRGRGSPSCTRSSPESTSPHRGRPSASEVSSKSDARGRADDR